YKGKDAPSARQRKIARTMVADIDLRKLTSKLSKAQLRDLQTVSYFIAFVRETSVTKFRTLVSSMNWDAIGTTIGEHWGSLPHEVTVLFCVAACDRETRFVIADLVRRNAGDMRMMPSRLAVVTPDLALEFVRGGKEVALASHDHVEWRAAPHLIKYFA